VKHTAIPSGALPERSLAESSPDLVYRKWHAYDRFEPERIDLPNGNVKILDPFERKQTSLAYLRDVVAGRVQAVARDSYGPWHDRFDRATEALDAEVLDKLSTAWRLVSGWATNPALESGFTLHPLLGFPLVPGSMVKGLVHAMAERDLVEGKRAVPPCPGELPAQPPQALLASLLWARRIRVLFGSLASERAVVPQAGREVAVGPEAATDRLRAWQTAIAERWKDPEEVPAPWGKVVEALDTILAEAGTGALVTWFDAVPAKASVLSEEPILEPDVLASHHPAYYEESTVWRRTGPGSQPVPHDHEDPIPVTFLAVRPRTLFEFRARIKSWPAPAETGFDEAEEAPNVADERLTALEGWDKDRVREALVDWLKRALLFYGLGAKTTAGYGLFGNPPAPVDTSEPDRRALSRLEPEPDEDTVGSPEETWAREAVPEGQRGRLADLIDNVLPNESEPRQRAAARRIADIYSEDIADWRTRQKASIQKRIAWLDKWSGEDS